MKKRIWVHPSFSKRLKVNATLRGMSIIDYTKKIGTEQEEFLTTNRKNEKKFKFKI